MSVQKASANLSRSSIRVQLPGNFFSLPDKVRQADLSCLCIRAVIRGIAIGDQNTVEMEAEDRLGHFRRSVAVDVEERQITIPRVPRIMTEAVISPRGHIGMNDGRCLDLLPQVFINRRPLCHRLPVKPHRGGGNEVQAEQVFEHLLHLSVGHAYPIP